MSATGKPLEELVTVFFGHAKKVGDHPQRERTRESLDELALTRSEEVVEDVVGELPHRVLVLLEALRRDQPHQQRTVIGVGRRVEGRQLVAERNLVAVLLDQFGDVVTLERDRKPRERAGHRDAGRERLGVVVDVDGLLPAGHHRDAVVVLPLHRALIAKCLVDRVRVVDQPTIPEIIDSEVRSSSMRHSVPNDLDLRERDSHI